MKQTFYILIILFLGCTSKRADTNNTKVEKDQIADTTIASKPEPNDTVYIISDRNIVSDKNFKMTYEFMFTNKSKRVVTNILFFRGKKNSTNGMDEMYGKENTKYEEVNKEINLKPGESKLFTFKTRYSNLADIYFQNEWVVSKIRFQNGDIFEPESIFSQK